MTTKAVHESTAKATDNSKLLDELKKELNVFVHSDAEPLCSHIPWRLGLTKVTCLIKAHVVIAKDLKLCTENLSRKCGLQRVPGHILWCKATGLRVAVPEWLRHDALGSLDVPGLSIKFITVGSKKLGIYVNKSVSRSSTEFRSLDHAMSFPGSKWELLAPQLSTMTGSKKEAGRSFPLQDRGRYCKAH